MASSFTAASSNGLDAAPLDAEAAEKAFTAYGSLAVVAALILGCALSLAYDGIKEYEPPGSFQYDVFVTASCVAFALSLFSTVTLSYEYYFGERMLGDASIDSARAVAMYGSHAFPTVGRSLGRLFIPVSVISLLVGVVALALDRLEPKLGKLIVIITSSIGGLTTCVHLGQWILSTWVRRRCKLQEDATEMRRELLG
eukprot:TRINITY_DN124769_c0_g1_i1.p1 TRINITY_DN124769_c0_g1~~TRINITY_DN124769_c0_g1_i1.p1  ORF type:complete len:198 (-),score=13.78 TRINITY_DN124769_c0_g1_i1:96-689(-)